MKTTKEVNEKIRQYIIGCIDTSGYDKIRRNDNDRVLFVYETFKKEYCYEANLRRYGHETNVFNQWLRGLPSVINIDFENYKILELSRGWGFLKEGASEAKEQAIIDNWFNRIANAFFKMVKHAKQPGRKIRTIDIDAKEWFDKVNGNSYFSARVTVDLGYKGEQTIILPFQYGYGDHYKSMAFDELEKVGIIKDREHYPNGNGEMIWTYAERKGIIVRTSKEEKCMKAIKGYQDKRSVIKAIYLDWVNNWLTTSRMAEHYQMSEDRLDRIIYLGRNLMLRHLHYNGMRRKATNTPRYV